MAEASFAPSSSVSGHLEGLRYVRPRKTGLSKTTYCYLPVHERCIRWDKPEIGVKWLSVGALRLSGKDAVEAKLSDEGRVAQIRCRIAMWCGRHGRSLEAAMYWYLVHTKPRQEKCALENLERQGYQCYLPTFSSETLRQGQLTVIDEPLFPRYLFIRLGHGDSAKSWVPIRSTKGVSRLVSFGVEPAKVDDALIELLRVQESSLRGEPVRLFKSGERVRLTEAPFAGIEGIYQMADGEHRVMVLIEILSKPVALRVSPTNLRKAG